MLKNIFKKYVEAERKKESEQVQAVVDLKSAYGNVRPDIEENYRILQEIFGDSTDIKLRKFAFGRGTRKQALILFTDGLADSATVNREIVEPLMYGDRIGSRYTREDMTDIKGVLETMVVVGEAETADTFQQAVEGCLLGDTILFVDGFPQCLILGSKGYEKRSVDQTDNEVVVRGPKESFTENMRTNTALLRRKVRNPGLMVETIRLGKRTETPVVLVYIKGLTPESLLTEIRKRLSTIDTDCILDSGYIEQYIEDAPFSVFPTIGHTEKPDVLASKLLEGRAGIIVDGSPYAITMPLLFVEKFQSAEDYYIRPWFASLIRLFRYFSFAISILTPALYVSLTTFHQELLPTQLLYSMAAAREGVPFGAFFEAIFMLIMFEILREAGIRLPKPVGQTIGIVGALIMGESAVSAGIVGAPLLICIALAAVSGFVVSGLSNLQTILRIFFLVLAGTMGGFGICIGLILVMIHMTSLKSFGMNYFQPIAPFVSGDIKDTFVRMPLWTMFRRPRHMASDSVREQCPIPPGDEKGDA